MNNVTIVIKNKGFGIRWNRFEFWFQEDCSIEGNIHTVDAILSNVIRNFSFISNIDLNGELWNVMYF